MAEQRTARAPSASEGSGSRGDSPQTTKGHRQSAGEWRPMFIAAVRNSANIRAACQAAGINRATAYEHRAADPVFAAAWRDALDEALDVLEATAWQRAMKSSDTLLIFLLKAHRPEVYRERVDFHIDVIRETRRLAQEKGIDEAAAVAEAERLLRERRG